MTDEPPEASHSHRPIFHRDRMEYWAFVSQIISAIAVVGSLLFVGLQLRESAQTDLRNEANSTQTQWSQFRSSIYGNRNTADVLEAGLRRSRQLDAADELRFLYLMREHGWATYQIWDRTQAGLRPMQHFLVGAGPDFLRVICTPGGSDAWAKIRQEFPADYVEDLEELAPAFEAENGGSCSPQGPPQPLPVP